MIGVRVTKHGDRIGEDDLTVITSDRLVIDPLGPTAIVSIASDDSLCRWSVQDIIQSFTKPFGTSIGSILGCCEGINQRVTGDAFFLDRISITSFTGRNR